MIKKYTLLVFLILGFCSTVFGQVIVFTEHMGVSLDGTTSIAMSTFQNSGNQTFTGNADTRITMSSNGYPNASGGRNVFFSRDTEKHFEISEINTLGYSNLSLTLGHFKSTTESNNELLIEVSTDGTNYTSLQYSRDTGVGTSRWISIKPTGMIPATENLRIRFRQSTDAAEFRIDDLHLSGILSSTKEVDFCNLQFPQSGNISINTSFDVYAQVYESGITESAGQGPNIQGWIGYNSINNNPTGPDWTWIPANYYSDQGTFDEYRATIGPFPSGTYYYASRFQIDNGPYRYGGYSESSGGFWNGSTHVSGTLSVDEVDFCNLQDPNMGTINLGQAFSVYGQVYEEGVTPGLGQGLGIEAEIGYSLSNSHPETWTNWITASYNPTCINCIANANDEYLADLGSSIPAFGTYYYATRFKLNGGKWTYGGILADGSAGNIWDGITYVSGVLNVMAPKIKIEGNMGSFPHIQNGDDTPSGLDGTLFAAQYIGATQTKSYRIRNIGNFPLVISDITITGANPDNFSISVLPTSTIPAGETSILEVQFSPLASGDQFATVVIVNNDSNDSPYTFAIKGVGNCMTTYNSISPSAGPVGTTLTVDGSDFDINTMASINGLVMTTEFINSTTLEIIIPENATSGNVTITNALGCTSITPLSIKDNKISGCEGELMLTDLIISEVTDATTGGLTYVELYNGTGTTLSLGNYALAIYYNGAANPGNTINLDGVNLESNSTYIVALGKTGAANHFCPHEGGDGGLAHQSSAVGAINKKDNAHDMIRLVKSSGSIIVDQFGVYQDKSWMDASIITGDRGFNFRRINSASPLPNPDFTLNDWNIIDWVGSGLVSCDTNDYSDIGHFDFSGGQPPLINLQPNSPTGDCPLSASFTVSAAERLSGGLPLAYQWFYNAPGTLDWVEILSTDTVYTGQQGANLEILNTLHLNGYQYYVQVRENTETCYQASNAVRLTVNSTTWDGLTWTPTLPNQDTMVIINGDYTTSSNTESFTACSLVVNSGFHLNITEGYYVEILNDVLIHGTSPLDFGQITVETKGAFIQRGNGNDAGTFTIKDLGRTQVNKTTAIKQNWYDYTYWSSPVTNASVEASLNMASPNRRFYFEAQNYEDTDGDDIDDNGDDWQLAVGRMIPGIGYAATSNKSGTFPRQDMTTFEGEFNTGDIDVPIYTNTIATDKDWNFIGNPYASAINFKAVYNANSEVIHGSAYLWCQSSPPLTSNPGNHTFNFNQNDYAIICTGSGNIAGGKNEIPSDFIPSGQGFFVIGKDIGGHLTFKNSMRATDALSNLQFFRNDNSDNANRFWINLTSDNGVFSQILMAYVQGATDGFDGFSYDVERHLSSGLHAFIYSEIPESPKQYAIQGKAISSLSKNEKVPIGFRSSITLPTIYTLEIAQLEGVFFRDQPIYLKDKLLNLHHNLTDASYHFTSDVGDFRDRFEVVFQPETLAVPDQVMDSNALRILELKNDNFQIISNRNSKISHVQILDVSGKTLYQLKGSKAVETYVMNGLSHGVYIAIITLSSGEVINKRFIKNLE